MHVIVLVCKLSRIDHCVVNNSIMTLALSGMVRPCISNFLSSNLRTTFLRLLLLVSMINTENSNQTNHKIIIYEPTEDILPTACP